MMKKKLAMMAIAVVIGGVSIGFPVMANMNTESKGNIVFNHGEMAVYAADVDYLQSEIDSLYSEIPNEDRISADLGDFDFVRNNRIQSKGIIDYAGGKVVIDSSDFIYMANEIDELEYTYKQIILKYLNGINTYLAFDGSVTHDETDSDFTHSPTFDELITGISLSQEVETSTTSDNLSKDKGAWVNGEYITGNGNDVNAAYAQGYIDGVNHATENADISYVYHQHSGSASDGGGCYTKPDKHKHSNANGCYQYDPGHQHSESCEDGTWFHSYDCEGPDKGCPGHPKYICGKDESSPTNKLICKITEGTVVGYLLGCGKTTSTIESATIVFN